MNFDFSDDQKFLGKQARKFLSETCTSAHIRTVLNDTACAYHETLWKKVVDMGWLGTAIPQEHGGLGLGYLELCVLAEETGRALAPIPFSSTLYFFAEGLVLGGSDAQKAKLLPAIVNGDIIGCYAVSERDGPIDANRLSVKFDGKTLTGTKIPVADGDIATHALVLACGESGPGLVLVDLNAPGVTRRPVETLEPTRSHAEIIFNAAPGAWIGKAGQGGILHEAIMDRAAILLAFEQLGGATRCMEMARDYAGQRYAFGRQIGANQAIKHKLADMYIKNEIARSNCYYGAWALSANAAQLPEAAAAARLAASAAYGFAAKENIQVHGGMGFTWESDCHLFYRRAKLLAVQAGTPKHWQEKLVQRLEAANTT